MTKRFEDIPVSARLEGRVEETLATIRKRKNRRRARKILTGVGSAAAVFAVLLALGQINPALAARLPVIGGLFAQVEQEVSYKGNYSENAVTLATSLDAEEGSASAAGEDGGNDYVQTSGSITVTLSEFSGSSEALYFSMEIKNEEEFPADFIKTENMEDYQLSYDRLELLADVSICEMEEGNLTLYYLEGQFEDANTFVGIARIALDNLTEELPDTFTLALDIHRIWAELLTGEMETATSGDGEVKDRLVFDTKNYDGEWSFYVPVSMESEEIRTVAVDETNGDGEGISRVTRSLYEITADMILPSDAQACDYFIAICDADGDLLEHQGNSASVYQTYGRNTDTVYVYLCDYNGYMDELKGYYWSEDYAEKRKTKTFARYLDEHALFGTEVAF
ncbi:MAG: DUF4179 domain-containing protein [Clostridiales bacterium]|nr:DUF4179 domain-containing protein [Clostridiales bacterium]